MSETFDLVLAFDTDEPEFVRGFELGAIWNELKEWGHLDERAYTIHASNTEMAMRIAEALDVEFEAEIVDDTWTHVTFKPRTPW